MVRRRDQEDSRLLQALEPGLDVTRRPYAALAAKAGLSEDAVLARLEALQAEGTISRFGVVVRHRKLGYRANAMVVWDILDDQVCQAGQALAALPYVTLCYRRPRRLPIWPYNLFCMIHGRDRREVLRQIEAAAEVCGLTAVPREVLFSRRCFKQRGARYASGPGATEKERAA